MASNLSKAKVYGDNYVPAGENGIEVAEYDSAKVQYATYRDEKGEKVVTDKPCLFFHLKGQAPNKGRYGYLDRNSKLQIGQEVDLNSVVERHFTNGSGTIDRYDGEAL